MTSNTPKADETVTNAIPADVMVLQTKACCSAADCAVWQWRAGDEASNGGGCWMGPFRDGPHEGCPAQQHPGPWVGASRVAHPQKPPSPSPPPPPPPPSPPPSPWTPHWDNQGSYDAVMCESTPFWWPKDKKMYIMECVCRGPLDPKGICATTLSPSILLSL